MALLIGIWAVSTIAGWCIGYEKHRAAEGFWFGALLGPIGVLVALGLKDETPPDY